MIILNIKGLKTINRFIALSIVSSIIAVYLKIWSPIIIFWAPVAFIVALNLFNLITRQRIKAIDDFVQRQNNHIESILDFFLFITKIILLLRVPLVSSLLIVSFPLIANFNQGASKFAKNIFAMRNNLQVFLVMIAVAVTSIMIISLGKKILGAYEIDLEDSDRKKKNEKIFRWFRQVFWFILVAPTWLSVYFNSYPRLDINREDNIGQTSFWLGLITSIIVFAIAAFLDWNESTSNNKSSKPDRDKSLEQRRKIIFIIQAIVGIIFYVIVIALSRPGAKQATKFEFPALLYLFLLIWIATLLFGEITYFFDKSFNIYSKSPNVPNKANIINLESFRFPPLIIIFLFMGFSYFAWQVDHYFELIPITDKAEEIEYKSAFKTAITQRLVNQTDEEKTLVVVAASGGGIQASGWTTQVLAGLQQEKELGEDFTKAIGLISSTSGGSVGTMFYLDQFEDGVLSEDGLEKQNALTTVVAKSTDDWLDAVGWGLAFPDLFRVIGFPFPNIFKQYKYLDRGYSLEQDWQRGFKNSNTKVTLETWRQKIIQGEIPIPVFNSTLVENGRRFLISPMKFIPGSMQDYIVPKDEKFDEIKALDFKTLYADACSEGEKQQSCDLNVTTAARLSASFPYVSPVARNDRDNQIKIPTENNQEKTVSHNYHMADGGYFDNYGLYTAVEWLDEFLSESGKELNIKKVLIVQINAFPISQLKQEEEGKKGIGGAILAPLQTLYGVKDTTQLERNLTEVELLEDRWGNLEESDRVDIQHFVISFPKKDRDKNDYNPPLSWRLTKKEKHNLKDAWENDKTIDAEVKNIKTFWQS